MSIIMKWQQYAEQAHRKEVWAAVGAAAIAVGGSILSGKSAAKAQIDAVETPTRQSTIEQSLQEAFESQDTDSTTNVLEEIFGSEMTNQLSQAFQSAEEQAVIQRGNVQTQEALSQLQADLGQGTEERMQAAIDQVLRSGMPAVSGAGANAGAFNDTTTALLQNDLVARAASAGLAAEDTQRAQLLQAIQAGQAGTETSTGTSDVTSTEEATSTTDTSQSRDATESTESSSQTSSTQGDTTVSDAYANPGDAVRPTGDLAQLVNTGQGDQLLDVLSGSTGDLIDSRKQSANADDILSSDITDPSVQPTLPTNVRPTVTGSGLPEGAAARDTGLAAVINDPSIAMDDRGNLRINRGAVQ